MDLSKKEMNTRERKERLSNLVRENEGRKRASAYLSGLSRALQEDLSQGALLSLWETDVLFALWKKGFGSAGEGTMPAVRKQFDAQESGAVQELLKFFAPLVSDPQAVLFVRDFEVCGAIRVHAHCALLRALDLLSFDGDSVYLLGSTGRDGYLLDKYEHDGLKLEMVFWGENWGRLETHCTDPSRDKKEP
jgi:hypothetical protein